MTQVVGQEWVLSERFNHPANRVWTRRYGDRLALYVYKYGAQAHGWQVWDPDGVAPPEREKLLTNGKLVASDGSCLVFTLEQAQKYAEAVARVHCVGQEWRRLFQGTREQATADARAWMRRMEKDGWSPSFWDEERDDSETLIEYNVVAAVKCCPI